MQESGREVCKYVHRNSILLPIFIGGQGEILGQLKA